jgi:serine/threonine protein kinase
MAPELLIESCRLEAANFDSLQKVDMWAFGMVLFNLVNPNLKYPFQLDLKDAPLNKQRLCILQQQKYPTQSKKYALQQESSWAPVIAVMKKCLIFNPDDRLTASEIINQLQQLLSKSAEEQTFELEKW